jgi:hypothetical protein
MNTQIPPLCKVQLRLPEGTPVNVNETMRAQWQNLSLTSQVTGKRIAVGVGSRGVADIAGITRCLVNLIRMSGGEPYVIPAMGSHGGATSEGQIEVLHSLGVTESSVGCPVLATMDAVVLGHTTTGSLAYTDRLGAEADGLFIINRVKIHTDFHGRYESGLMKMLAIGLGNQIGAAQLHDRGVHGIRSLMPEIAQTIIQQGNLIAGIAVVEDGYHRPVECEIIPCNAIAQREPELLSYSRKITPHLPVENIDVLIVDMIGKEISGTGMDTNVIGRRRITGESELETPQIKTLVALDLSEASHGNATGIGLADFTVRRLLDKINFDLFTQNVLTSGFLRRGNIPLVFATDKEAIEAAIMTVGRDPSHSGDQPRVMRIRNTIELETLWISSNLVTEARSSPQFISMEPPKYLQFNSEGALFCPIDPVR